MIKAVIFDWGGVIAENQAGGWLDCLADMLDMTVDALKPHWRTGYYDFNTGKIDESEFWRRLEVSLGRPLPGEKSQIWIKGGALNPYPEMIDFIGELRANGVKTAILSNTVGPMTLLARSEELYEGFDAVVLSDEVGVAKPSPIIYQITIDSLGLSPEECLFVDDLPNNLAPASEMGVQTVLASNDFNKTIDSIRLALR